MIKTTLYIFTQKQFFFLEKVSYQVYVKLNASKTKENVKLKCKHYENSPLCHFISYSRIYLSFHKSHFCKNN